MSKNQTSRQQRIASQLTKELKSFPRIFGTQRSVIAVTIKCPGRVPPRVEEIEITYKNGSDTKPPTQLRYELEQQTKTFKGSSIADFPSIVKECRHQFTTYNDALGKVDGLGDTSCFNPNCYILLARQAANLCSKILNRCYEGKEFDRLSDLIEQWLASVVSKKKSEIADAYLCQDKVKSFLDGKFPTTPDKFPQTRTSPHTLRSLLLPPKPKN